MPFTKWGLIGPGNIAKEFASDLPFAGKDQSINAVLGRREESVNSFADEYNIQGRFTSITDFIEKGKPEIVYIATPHPLHYEEARACLQHKIPVLCEKPLCLNAEQTQQLIETANKTNTFLMEAMWIRFLPFFQKLLVLIKDGLIGDVVTVYGSMHYNAPFDPSSRYYNPSLGGGSLLDLGVYPVFLATLILGEPEIIKSFASLTDKGIDDSCNAFMQYSNGAHAIIESSLRKDENEPAVITGTKGNLKILHPWFEKSPGLKIELNNGEEMEYPFSWNGHGLHFEIKEVLDCLDKGVTESDQMPHRLSLGIVKVMDEIRKQTGIKYNQFE